MDECVLCGSEWVEGHHVVFRSRGGGEETIRPTCRRCHDAIHAHKIELRLVDEALACYRDGVRIWLRQPVSNTEFAQAWEHVMAMLEMAEQIERLAPNMNWDQLRHSWDQAQAMGQLATRTRRVIISQAWQLSLVLELPDAERRKQLARTFDISVGEINHYVRIIGQLGAKVLVDSPLGLEFQLAAAASGEPTKWLAHAQEERELNPHYTPADLRADIKGEPRPGVCAACGQRMIRRWYCPECGHA